MDPHVAVHGSFSVMVNYHAIGLYCTSRAGFVLHDPQEEASLKVSVLVFIGDEEDDFFSMDVKFEKMHSIPRDSDSGSIQTWTGSEVERLSAATHESFCDRSVPLIRVLGTVTCIPTSVSRVL